MICLSPADKVMMSCPALGYARKCHLNTCQFMYAYILHINVSRSAAHTAPVSCTPTCHFSTTPIFPPCLKKISEELLNSLVRNFAMPKHVPPPLYHGVRVGEATNPGPQDLAAFNLAIVNPTAIRNKLEEMTNLQKQYNLHAIACAETSATAQVQNEMTVKFRQMKFRSFWSSPVDPQRVKLNQEPSLRGKSEGTSLHTSLYARHSFDPIKESWKFATRLTHSIVKVATNLHIQVFVIYGPTGSIAGHAQVTNEILQAAWDMSKRIALPSLFVGDFNLDVRQLPCFQDMQPSGFRALQDMHLALKNMEMPPTCKHVTTPDTAILHPLLAQRLQDIQVDKSAVFDSHDPVIISFAFPVPS